MGAEIKGRIATNENTAAAFATVGLITFSDSTIYKGTSSNDAGEYVFENISAGTYMVTVMALGFEKYFSAKITLVNNSEEFIVPPITLIANNIELNAVTVAATKPFIERKPDRLVINTENKIVAADDNVLDIIKKSPGVTVDKDDNISVKGRQGVVIMIDEKPMYVSAQDAANMLKNMGSTSVEKIEIITNPSAKYDAAGNAGIINIVSKRSKNRDWNGSIRGTLQQGSHTTFNGGLNASKKFGKANFYLNYGNYNWNNKDILDLERSVIYQGDTTLFNQRGNFDPKGTSHDFKTGIDLDLNLKHTLGFSATLYTEVENNKSLTSSMFGPESNLALQQLIFLSHEKSNWLNYTGNVYWNYTIDSTGKKLSMALDYSKHGGTNSENMSTNVAIAGDTQPTIATSNVQPTDITIMAGKVDMEIPLSDKFKIEYGTKFSNVKTAAETDFKTNKNGMYQTDSLLTQQFTYREQIGAGYANATFQLNKKTSLTTGLRAEHTNSIGESVSLKKIVDRKYLNFFPSVFVSHDINEKNNLSLSYGRRIDRPSYQDLNPFLSFLDPYAFQKGNPFLRPQYTDNLEVSYLLMQMIYFSVSFANTNDVMIVVTEQDDSSKATYAINRNLDNLKETSINFSSPIPIAKWWTTHVTLSAFNNNYTSKFEGENLSNNRWTGYAQCENEITLGKNMVAQVSGDYMTGAAYGILNIRPQYGIDLGISKKVMHDKGTLRAGITDVFNLRQNLIDVKFQNMDIYLRDKNETRRIRVSFTYRFGNNENQRKRNSATEDEQKRVKKG